jgi:arylsulfatase A-like enzyme
MRTILTFIFALSILHGQAQKQSKPNVVFILMDDMGYGDIGPTGGFPYHTPNLDKLAAEGMRFTNFYAAQGVCSA